LGLKTEARIKSSIYQNQLPIFKPVFGIKIYVQLTNTLVSKESQDCENLEKVTKKVKNIF
jgi:hypothetical protein